MPADTFSTTLGVLLMGTGNDNNSWGSNANTSVFQILEDSIANVLTSSVTGGTLDLSGTPPPTGPSQVRYYALVFNGVLGSAQILKVPNLTKTWWVQNNTTGAFTLTVKTPTGSASTAIPQNGGWQIVSCDGNNNITVAPFNFKQIQMPDGSASLPAYSNVNETNSGWYRNGAGDWRLSILGTDILKVTGSVVNVLTGTLQQGGVAVATGAKAGVSGTPTAGHLATWFDSATVQDGGAAGALANISTVTGQYIDQTVTGFNAPLNLQLSASVGSNLLTVTVLTADGSTPSAAKPVWLSFPDATAANGDPINIALTSALSISTNAVGATLGSTNNNSFRFWIAIFNNGGTPVLALINCSTPTQIFPLAPTGIASTTQMSASATSAGVFYTPNGTTLSSKAFRVIGFLSYETALVTAGTYNVAPDNVRLYGPGVKLPGDVVQMVYATTSTPTTVSNTANSKTATNTTASITPTSKANLVLARATGSMNSALAQSGNGILAQLSRGSGPTLIGTIAACGCSAPSGGPSAPVVLEALDFPQTTGAQAYTVYAWSNANNSGDTWLTYFNGAANAQSTITLQELMG